MPRRSTAQVADSRAAIVAAAVDQASLYGLEGVTIGKLATELEMSKSGLIGHFGSKEGLQLAALAQAAAIFTREVWEPVEKRPPGTARLLALCDSWLSYLRRDVFPGGCFLTTASVEFDARSGPVHDAIAAQMRRWLGVLEAEVAAARAAGELPSDIDPADAAFALNAVAVGANCAYQLHRDRRALARARRAMHRVLGL
jgi:AcrR family transcriptional regulator